MWCWWMMIGCGEPPLAPQVDPKPQAAPPVEPSETAPAKAASPHGERTVTPEQGIVRETMDSGGYTYARVDHCGDELWIAGPQQQLAQGQTVSFGGAMTMHGFHSKTLDRTFPEILFAKGFTVSSDPVDCSGDAAPATPARPQLAFDPHGSKAPGPSPAAQAVGTDRQGKVVETMSSGGYRYARVDFCGEEVWVAAPEVPVQVGQTIAAGAGSPMSGFHSKTLDRTFSRIDFVGGLTVVAGEPDCG